MGIFTTEEDVRRMEERRKQEEERVITESTFTEDTTFLPREIFVRPGEGDEMKSGHAARIKTPPERGQGDYKHISLQVEGEIRYTSPKVKNITNLSESQKILLMIVEYDPQVFIDGYYGYHTDKRSGRKTPITGDEFSYNVRELVIRFICEKSDYRKKLRPPELTEELKLRGINR
jgi:hypothetical protein